ncbi:Phosphoribosylamine--glycine ligase, chloroplastic [Galdieria sulphuraria]|nr:Phosphoribosylamine--glycine ligase, chloroplastic [Galdieria sulphuraria]
MTAGSSLLALLFPCQSLSFVSGISSVSSLLDIRSLSPNNVRNYQRQLRGVVSFAQKIKQTRRSSIVQTPGNGLPRFIWIYCVASDSVKKALHVAVIGSGGREHALCDTISQSPMCNKLFAIPGNAGMRACAVVVENIHPHETEKIVEFCKHNEVDFVIVGPEIPLVEGLVDKLTRAGIAAFGPHSNAAILEGSKVWMKQFLKRRNIPTAQYECFRNSQLAKSYVNKQQFPLVIKANGLAAGKGVIIAEDRTTANQAIVSILDDTMFGSAGSEIVIEEYLQGEELSFFALVDGLTVIPFGSAQDHKRAFDQDLGPNTGGMGAYSPSPLCTESLENDIIQNILKPTVQGMMEEGRPYRGILYCGLMLTKDGPKVLEYNVRFGDPECQVICPRLKSDLLQVLYKVATGDTKDLDIEWHKNLWSLVVIMASQGYPGAYQKGTVIQHLQEASNIDGVKIYHSGTDLSSKGEWIATGGRVLGITGIGNSIQQARDKAYSAIEQIHWPQGFYRKDIGWKCLHIETSGR